MVRSPSHAAVRDMPRAWVRSFAGSVRVTVSERNPNAFDAVKVFSATKAREREELGETVTRWLADQRGRREVVDKVVSQSSDNEFHCLSIILFLRTKSD